uniref:ZP domain-containing protein n=1 Tax=Strongyloides papillosus TaxID=174720 RepID=A0A0N5C0D4_STREA
MFVKLYLLGAALALMPLPIQSYEEYDQKLFPDIPQNINRNTFPIILEVKKPSNMVLVKCPDVGYRDINGGHEFENSNEVVKYKNFVPLNTSLFVWVPLLKESSNSTQFNCGKIIIKSDETSSDMIDWTYDVRWNNVKEDKTKINSNNMDFLLPVTPKECQDGTENLLVVSKDKENDTAVIIDPLDVMNPYANQEFYYFIKPEQNDGRQIIEHCARYRGYKNPPHFNLPDYNDNSTINEVKKININELNYEKEEKIKINLKLGDDIQFYRDEGISLSRMKYTIGGLIDIENSTQQINSSFTIKGFDLVKLVYNHLNAAGYIEVSQVYYFGPASKNFTIEKYFENEVDYSFKPNCPIYFMNVGYLDKVIYDEIEGSIYSLNSTAGIEGRFNITSDFIFFEEKEDRDTKLVCIYKTLDGIIAISNVYEHQDIVHDHQDIVSDHQDVVSDHQDIVHDHQDIVYDHKNIVSDHQDIVSDHQDIASDVNMSVGYSHNFTYHRETRIFGIPGTILGASMLFLLLFLTVVIIIAFRKPH